MEVFLRNGFVGRMSGDSLVSALKPKQPPQQDPKPSALTADSLKVSALKVGIAREAVLFKDGIVRGVRVSEDNKLSGKVTEISNYRIDNQGNTNACGTTSLASVLRYFGSAVKDHWEIDKEIRSARFDMFTAPRDIVQYAKEKGFNAGLRNNGSYEEMASFIDKGIPVMTLTDTGSEYDFYMHWTVITGYERDEQGKISKLRIADPSGGYTKTREVDTFDKNWRNVKVGYENISVLGSSTYKTGYNRLFIVVAPKNKNVTAPDGSIFNTSKIKVPDNYDTVQGYGAQVVAKASRLIDKTVSLTEKIASKIGW